jgi:predicted anti-sigma-YlaC factor YlaD
MTRHEHSHQAHGPRDPRCLEIFARLSEYLDGELDEMDCSLIEEHIRDCEPCVEFLRSLRSSIDAAHSYAAQVQPSQIPPELESRLKQAWQEALRRRKPA